MSSLSSTVLAADSTDLENTNLRSKKIQIYPDSNLKKEWNKWVAACRYCFNQAIAYQKKNERVSKLKLRNIIMNSDLPEWVKSAPCHIRQNAIFDAHGAYTASKDCKFRSCKAPRLTIKFNHSNYKLGKWYPNLTKGLTFIASEPLPNNSKYATQLIKTKNGWFAVFLEERNIRPSKGDGQVIALDPGVRSFLTGFDGNQFVEFGKSDMGRVARLCQHLDALMSRSAKSPSRRQRQKMRQAAARLRSKIRNLVDECHKQVSNWLVNNYQYILLPTFKTSEMTNKKRRKIRSKTARQMLNWAHYRFKLHLKQKAELNDCNVIDVTEEFTSKTCTSCGHVHRKLGGAKVFKCPVCNHTIARDFNGAFGILLKALRDTSYTISDDSVAIVALPDNISSCVA
ncbi:MAG TPA: transposase [Leptolyngbyaceae cyanobacterium]